MRKKIISIFVGYQSFENHYASDFFETPENIDMLVWHNVKSSALEKLPNAIQTEQEQSSRVTDDTSLATASEIWDSLQSAVERGHDDDPIYLLVDTHGHAHLERESVQIYHAPTSSTENVNIEGASNNVAETET